MRERAEQVGAQLNLWSEAGAGTEVELRVPAAVAYRIPGRGRLFSPGRNQGADDDRQADDDPRAHG